ncbi:MAG: hypothetical protein FJX67_03320 [Alphaproteobacteria bacterium]|nr:hypothetical protein [Alphaproteobacteria bacterium]
MEHSGSAWAIAIERSGLGQVMRESIWLYPTANVLHVLSAAILVGAILILDLRLLGLVRAIAIERLAALVLPVAKASFAVAVSAGFLLFSTEATAFVENPVFLIKLLLIAAALGNIALFHAGAFRRIGDWGHAGGDAPASARRAGLASLVLWIAAFACGRLIAYF